MAVTLNLLFKKILILFSFRHAEKSGRKTNTYKSSSGKIIWSVTVKGSFTFNGKTSSCTSSSVTTSCPGAGWKITSSSANKSGATASASATAKNILMENV